MLKNITMLIMSMVALVFVNACVSFSSHQTAEVLGEDQVEWGEGFGYLMYDFQTMSYDQDGNETGMKDESLSVPYFPETIFRFGINDKMDVGIKVAGVISNIEADLKYQLLKAGDDSSNFSLAVQPSVSGLVMGPLSMYKFGLGVIASQRISTKLAFYGNVKYNYLMTSVDDTDTSSDSDGSDAFSSGGNFYTAALGLSFEGKSFWIRPEVTLVLNDEFKKILMVPAIGFGLRF